MNWDYFSMLSNSEDGPNSIDDFIVRYHKLIATRKKTKADEVREEWKKNNISIGIENQLGSLIDSIQNPQIDLFILPKFSFLIQFRFTLEKPYISRGEQEFYIIDNPIHKDKVFDLPCIAPSSWKGSLRAALWQLGNKSEDEKIRRIFGNERAVEAQERLRAGRLHIFPTFFTRKGLEIINPHDRERRVGRNPILIETVPQGSAGFFSLLYVPFDLIGKEEEEIQAQITSDMGLITVGLNAMFRNYGFGAKTSSGFGIAKPELEEGKFILKAEGVETSKEQEPEPPEQSFQKYLNEDGSVKQEFRGSGEAGLLSNPEYGKRRQQTGGGSLKEFKKFRRWYGNSGEQWQRFIQSQNAPHRKWPTWTFKNFDELLRIPDKIETSLQSKEGVE